MRKSEQKEHIEYVFRNLLRVAKELNTAEAWGYLFTWSRARQGGRHKALGRRGDNDWCYRQIPESKQIYDPALMRKTMLPDMHPDPDPDYVETP